MRLGVGPAQHGNRHLDIGRRIVGIGKGRALVSVGVLERGNSGGERVCIVIGIANDADVLPIARVIHAVQESQEDSS